MPQNPVLTTKAPLLSLTLGLVAPRPSTESRGGQNRAQYSQIMKNKGSFGNQKEARDDPISTEALH